MVLPIVITDPVIFNEPVICTVEPEAYIKLLLLVLLVPLPNMKAPTFELDILYIP